MTYGKLTVVMGPMFGGKTTHIIDAVNGSDSVAVFKPSMDTRYAENEVVTHDGKRVSATPVAGIDDLIHDHQLVCFDEIQFFTTPHFSDDIIGVVKSMLNEGRDVLACGLDTDWRGDPFPVTSLLAGMADEVIKLKSSCSVCGDKASKTFKKTREGSVIELGHNDIYEARCNHHWTN